METPQVQPHESVASPSPETPSAIIKRLGPTSIMAVLSLALPPLGGFLVIGFMDTIATWLTGHGGTGWLIYLASFAVLSGLALLPTYAQSTLGGWAFGIWAGFAGAIGGFIGGALIGYVLNAGVTGERVIKLIDEHPKWAAVRNALVPDAAKADPARNGEPPRSIVSGHLKTLGIVMLIRLPPTSPFSLTNLLLASVRVPLWIYLLGTAIGMAPRTLVAVWLGHTLHQQFQSIREGLSAPKPWWLLALGVVVSMIVLAIIGVIANKAIERVTRRQTLPEMP